MNAKDVKRILEKSHLFAGVPEAQLDEVTSIASVKKVSRGKRIFFEGDEAIGFYMVAEGKVKIFKTSLEGREQILHIFGPGEPFGEVPVFHGQPFPAHAEALTAGKLLFFPREKFTGLVHANPSLALNMLAMLSLRLRRFANQIEQLSLKEVPGRLAAHLLYLCEEQGRQDQVTLDIPKGQLASLLGTSPETLSRIFAKMSDEGILRVQGKVIQLTNIERLQEL